MKRNVSKIPMPAFGENNINTRIKETRSWDTIINGTKPISIWKYKVAGNSVSLIEEQNMDDLISLIK